MNLFIKLIFVAELIGFLTYLPVVPVDSIHIVGNHYLFEAKLLPHRVPDVFCLADNNSVLIACSSDRSGLYQVMCDVLGCDAFGCNIGDWRNMTDVPCGSTTFVDAVILVNIWQAKGVWT